MLTWRTSRPCARCAYAADCDYILRELAHVVRHLNEVAELAERRTCDAEVVLDCPTYWPRSRKESSR